MKGDLRVYWQACDEDPIYWRVDSVEQGKEYVQLLNAYSSEYLSDTYVVYGSFGGLEGHDGKEWSEWLYDETDEEACMFRLVRREAEEQVQPDPVKGDLRVWWIPNPPREGFFFRVETFEQAKRALNVLADHDLYLEEKVVANAGGLLVLEDGDWEEWEDFETGVSINDIMAEENDVIRRPPQAQNDPGDGSVERLWER